MLRSPRLLFTIIAAIAFASLALAEEKPADKPKEPAKEAAKDPKDAPPRAPAGKPGVDYHLSAPIVKEVKDINDFISGETEATYEKMGEALEKIFFPLMSKEGENGAVFDYPAIFVYRGATEDLKKSFKLQTGYPVKAGAKEIGEFKVKKLEGFRCISAYYTGPLMHLSAAYKSLYGQLAKDGHTPVGQSRELYLFWDGEDSDNTVVEIQIGIAPVKGK